MRMVFEAPWSRFRLTLSAVSREGIPLQGVLAAPGEDSFEPRDRAVGMVPQNRCRFDDQHLRLCHRCGAESVALCRRSPTPGPKPSATRRWKRGCARTCTRSIIGAVSGAGRSRQYQDWCVQRPPLPSGWASDSHGCHFRERATIRLQDSVGLEYRARHFAN